jgi:competence protein ComEA
MKNARMSTSANTITSRSLGLLLAALLLAPMAADAKKPAQKSPPAAAEGVVNINTATSDQLTLLPGIGPTKAQRIVAYRQKRKKFRQIWELVRVRGIGRKTLRRLRRFLTLKGPTTLTKRPSRKRKSS